MNLNPHHQAPDFEYEDTMDVGNISENMTVPHPSMNQTTAPSTMTSNNQIYSTHHELNQHMQGQHQHLHRHQQQQQHQNQQQQHQHQQHPQHLQQPQATCQPQIVQNQATNQQPYQQYYQPANQQQQIYYQSGANENIAPAHDTIMKQLMELAFDNQQTDELVKKNREAHQNFVLQLQNRNKLAQHLNMRESSSPQDINCVEKARRELNAFENAIRQKVVELNDIRRKLIETQCGIYDRLIQIQNQVINEHLPRWHREQQYSSNGLEMGTISLDQIQAWVEKLVDVTWRLKMQIKGFQLTLTDKPHVPFDIQELERYTILINKSLETLILKTFVVEKQPPQVMKTNTRFTSTVRFLCGSKLGVQMINPTVKAIILSENNARSIIQRHKDLIRSSWSYLDMLVNQNNQHVNVINNTPNAQAQPMTYLIDQSNNMMSNSAPPTSPRQIQNQASAQISTHQHQFFPQQQQHPSQFIVQQQPIQPPPMQYDHQVQELAYDNQVYENRGKILNVSDFDPSGEILNNSNILEYQESTGQLLCHFRNMQLKKIKRTEKKGTESVMDEKFVLLFVTEFRIADDGLCSFSSTNRSSGSRYLQGDLSFQLMAFSLPVVVIVHGNQEPHAWATVTWHNAFATSDDFLYQVPDKVRWKELGSVLSEKFRSCAGKGLSSHNLEYLGSKVYGSQMDSDDVLVSWKQFSKDTLADKSFTFWEWFHSILKLTKEHLRSLWNANRIYGFVGKKGCIDLLLGSSCHEPAPVGTFLLRYSETELGGITIAWVAGSSHLHKNDSKVQVSQRLSPMTTGSNVLLHLQPFGSKDLNTRSLADRIRDLKDLVFLYPDIPKDEAFQAHYTPMNDSNLLANGYVKPMLIQTLDYPKDPSGDSRNLSTSNSMDCTATPSPQNLYSHSSPDPIFMDPVIAKYMSSGM